MIEEPVPVRQHLARIVMPRPSEIRRAVKEIEGFNAKLAFLITRGVGTMACAYVFAALALISLPMRSGPGARRSSPGSRRRSCSSCS